jgi:hypothetical protein
MFGNKINTLLKDNSNWCLGYIDNDNNQYDTLKDLYKHYLLNLCSCGNPDETYQFCVNILKNTNNIINLVKNDPENTGIMFISYFNHLELLEHGSSLYGSFMTEKGDDFIYPYITGEKDINDMQYKDMLLLQCYENVNGVFEIIDMIKDEHEQAADALIDLFKELELLNDNLTLTSDGQYICEAI